MYAHVTDGAVDAIGNPPATIWDGTRWWDLRGMDPADLARAGWYEIIRTPRPDDTRTTVYARRFTFAGGVVSEVWEGSPRSAEGIAAWDADVAAEANRTTIETQARQAFISNRQYINRANPTAAQTTAQVKALSQQMNAVMRLVFNDLTGTD